MAAAKGKSKASKNPAGETAVKKERAGPVKSELPDKGADSEGDLSTTAAGSGTTVFGMLPGPTKRKAEPKPVPAQGKKAPKAKAGKPKAKRAPPPAPNKGLKKKVVPATLRWSPCKMCLKSPEDPVCQPQAFSQ